MLLIGTGWWIIGLVAAGLFYYYFWFYGRKHCHPGPLPFPLFGNVLSIFIKDYTIRFDEYRKRYGDVFTFWCFHKPIVVLSGYDVIREAFVKRADDFSGRPKADIWDNSCECPGVFTSDGKDWSYYRRFVLRTLRDFGMGKNLMEMRIHEEIVALIEYIDAAGTEPFDLTEKMQTAIANVTSSLALGKRFGLHDEQFNALQRSTVMVFENQFALMLPEAAKKIPGDPFRAGQLQENIRNMVAIIRGFVDEHVESYDENNLSDVIYAYIHHAGMDKQKSNDLTDSKRFLTRLVAELFLGGIDTSSAFMSWVVLHLDRNLDIQERMASEVTNVVSGDRLPSVKDKTNMTLTQSFLEEVHRYTTIVPVSAPHVACRDCEFRGRTIKKGSILLGILEADLKKQTLWDRSEEFDPERFIRSGKLEARTEMMPFSIGARACPGEALARMEIFLFTTALLQRYSFSVVSTASAPPLDKVNGFVVRPKPYLVRASKRPR